MTYLEAYEQASRLLSVAGPRSKRIDMPGGGYVITSLYDGEDEARDAAGRDMLKRIDAQTARRKRNP